jgi:predicted esterase YcpF (UPF0227 family)
LSLDIEELKNVDIRTVNADTLVDIREVVINKDLTGIERMTDFIRQIKNPYCYKYKKAVIKVEHIDTEVTLEDRLTSYFASL